MITIAIIDDHKMLRQGIRVFLEAEPDFKVVGEAENGAEGMEVLTREKPDIALVDIMMAGGVSGIELTRRASALLPETRVIVVSMLDSQEYVDQSLGAGAWGYVVKGAGIVELVAAIRAVHSGQRFLSSSLIKKDLAADR